ncbi:hypothetical protein KPC81_06322 [Klebsiella pneumoniae]|nr:hypothetical protein [Klebsiella pneumoniae]MCB8871519.1 hypothetical protein [Klebsiella pneumoniae]
MSQRGFYGISIFMNGITNIFLRGVGIMSKMFALLLLSAWLRPCAAQGNELVMATTFSPSATVWIIENIHNGRFNPAIF